MAKSDSIQYRYREMPVDPTLINNFSVEDKLHYSPRPRSDEILDLIDLLFQKIRDIIDNRLTTRQQQVVESIYFRQMTQTEVAIELGLCQPTVHKVLKGNIDYQNGGKRYGGALKKIRKICDADPEIQDLLAKIQKARAETNP